MKLPWRRGKETSQAAALGYDEPEASKLDPDAPVSTGGDRLGRSPFAARLAQQIELAPSTGLVIALIGPWGSGKTSVLRMVEERLKQSQSAENPDRIVVAFNPWLVSGSEQLVSQFVAELAVAVPQALGPSRGARAGKRLQRYAAGLQTLERIPGIGWMAQVSGALINEAGRRADDSPETLREQRDSARQALKELRVQIVVLVDDVDRLQRAEIRDLMRMIKLVGDFPNVTYLLAFDRDVVRAALTAEGTDGSEYIEKIVQIEYRLPEPPPQLLQDLLVERINGAIGDLPDERLATERWEAIYTQVIRPLITRPRHVSRFTNALPLALTLTGEEVDAVDVIALTALQTLLPKFHDRLLELRDDLTPPLSRLVQWRRNDAQEASAARLNEAAEASGESAVAQAVYRLLFPASMAALSNSYTDEQAVWRATRRVADREAFDTYFTATLPEGVLSVFEVRQAVNGFAEGPVALAAIFDAQSPERIPALLQRVSSHLEEIELEDIALCLPVLDAQIARLRGTDGGLWPPADQVRSFTRDLIGRFPQGEARDAMVRRQFEVSTSLTRKLMWLRSIGAWESESEPFCSPEMTMALRTELAIAVLQASPEVLLTEERSGWLLRTAEDDGGEGASQVVGGLLEDGRLLPAYLGAFLALQPGYGDYQLQFDELDKRQGRNRLLAALDRLDLSSLDEQDRARAQQLAYHYSERSEQQSD